MLDLLKAEANRTYTENGALTYATQQQCVFGSLCFGGGFTRRWHGGYRVVGAAGFCGG